MNFIQFSTTSQQNALNFLNHNSFSYLSTKEKEFIVNNLGKIRVLDPSMHGGGQLSFEDQTLLIDFIKLKDISKDENYMFRYGYLYHSWPLVKYGLEQGLEYYSSTTEKLVLNSNLEALKELVEAKIVSLDSICFYLEKSSFKFILSLVETFNIKKLNPYYLKHINSSELLALINKKLFSMKDLSYSNKEAYLEIMRFKKVRNEYAKKIKNTIPELVESYKKEANSKFNQMGFSLHNY